LSFCRLRGFVFSPPSRRAPKGAPPKRARTITAPGFGARPSPQGKSANFQSISRRLQRGRRRVMISDGGVW
jgi:hypothetical protein